MKPYPLAMAVMIVAVLFSLALLFIPKGGKPQQPSPPAYPPEVYADFPGKAPPQPGDWLARYQERGQTVEEYKEHGTNQKSEERSIIRIQPMGKILQNHPDIVELLCEYVGIFYDCKTEITDPVEMPREAYDKSRNQYNASAILRERRPGKALAFVSFCEEDLFVDDMNFVFGIGLMKKRIGIYSLARYGNKKDRINGEPIFLKRTLKVATHEIGHILGMEHCIRFECNMNGSNSLPEMDREPMYLCPECLEKARWCTGLNVRDRYVKLAGFYEKAGLTHDAAFAQNQASRIK